MGDQETRGYICYYLYIRFSWEGKEFFVMQHYNISCRMGNEYWVYLAHVFKKQS